MSQWPIFKIRNLVASYIGGGWGNDEANSEFSEPAFVIRGTDIPPLKTGTINPEIYRYHKPSNLRSRTLVEGDIVFEVSGGSAGQPLGRNALITDSILEKFGAPVMCASFCKMIRPNRDVVDPAFLQRLFDYLLHVEKIQQFEVQSTGISNYQFEDFLDYQKIPLPPLPLQRQIAAVLGRYDALLENYQAQVAALEAVAQELYREWFVRGRCPGAEAGPNGELPTGWEVLKVTDCFDITGGGTPSRDEPTYWEDGTVNWYTPTDVTGGKSLFLTESSEKITERGLQSSSARLFPAYSVMMTSRATIGAVAINTEPAATNQGFIVCLPNERFSYAFIYFWLMHNQATFEMLANGATFLEITKGHFKNIDVIVPHDEQLQAFDKIVLPVFKKIENLQAQITTLRATRDALLPRLLSGQLLPEEWLAEAPAPVAETT